jgi:DNA sulfur modification protein DndE
MKKLSHFMILLACSALMSLSATTLFAQDKKSTLSPDDATAKLAYALGVQAYIWGYPMVVMQKSRDAMTKGGETPVTPDQFNKSGLLFAPVNQIANAWGMLGPKFSAVQSGNSDTQYSVTWFDSSEEPYVLHIPKSNGRYYTFQFIDAYTNNFHYASTRTMGSQDQHYALVAPGWTGKLPEGVTRVDCPTPTGFIIGRWFVASEKDVSAVNDIQRQVTMTPLSSFGKKYTPPKVPVVPAKKYAGDLGFFEQLGDTLVLNGAPAVDDGLLGL